MIADNLEKMALKLTGRLFIKPVQGDDNHKKGTGIDTNNPAKRS